MAPLRWFSTRWFSTRWFSTTVVALLVALAAGGGAHAQAGNNAYTVTDDLLRRMAEKKIYLVPTDFTVDDFEAMARRPGISAEDGKAVHERLEKITAGVHDRLARAVKLGVPIAAGSDAYYALPGKTRGQAALNMFHAYVDAGLKPLDILRAATLNAADLLGIQDRTGTLEAGKSADLIAVPGDPLTDIKQLEKVDFVMKGGAVVRNDREETGKPAGKMR